MSRIARLSLIAAIGVLGLATGLGLAWRAAYRAANLSETLMVLPDVAGADVEVIYTNSDTLAKQEDISVYLSDASDNKSWVPKRLRRALVFRYDPAGPNAPLPSIMSPRPGRLLISIPRVSSVALRKTQWNGLSIDYQIGRIDYP